MASHYPIELPKMSDRRVRWRAGQGPTPDERGAAAMALARKTKLYWQIRAMMGEMSPDAAEEAARRCGAV